RFEPGNDPLDVLRRTAAGIPEHEYVRLVRLDAASNGRSDVDHPPTASRARLLRADPTPTTSVFAPAKDDGLANAARAAAANRPTTNGLASTMVGNTVMPGG